MRRILPGRATWPQQRNVHNKNPSLVALGKNDLKAIQNLIIFLMACWIEFYSILVPTWAQVCTQNLPKIKPSWK